MQMYHLCFFLWHMLIKLTIAVDIRILPLDIQLVKYDLIFLIPRQNISLWYRVMQHEVSVHFTCKTGAVTQHSNRP